MSRIMSSRWRRLLVVTTVVAMLAGAAAWFWIRRSGKPPTAVAAAGLGALDPVPQLTGDRIAVGSAGGTFRVGGIEVTVPTDAVAAGTEIALQAVAQPGKQGDEAFGRPISVEHNSPINAPLTIRWDVANLSARQRAAAVLVRWDADLRVWKTTREPLAVDGDHLVAQVQEFSIIDWVTNGAANLGQVAGQWAGKRVPEPRCSGEKLHGWVKEVVEPDTDLTATAIRTCVEPDRDEIATVRVANNRTFGQRLRRSGGGDDPWAWRWPGPAQSTVGSLVYDSARTVFDNGTSYLVPPLAEVAVGVNRPSIAGQTVIMVRAEVDALTVFADIAALTLESLPVGGLDNPLLNVFAQVMFECGGKQLMALSTGGDAGAVAQAVLRTVGSCAGEMMRADSEFGAIFEARVQEKIRTTPAAAATAAKAHRYIHEAAAAFRTLELGDIAFYVSDQFANALVGPVALSIRGNGRPQVLGTWTPTCTDAKADANALYKNVALQDAFVGSSDLSANAQWRPSARTAVRPLDGCTDRYLHQLADRLPGSWGDRKAAGVVAEEIRALTANPLAGSNPCASDDEILKLVKAKMTHATRIRLSPSNSRTCEASWMYLTASNFLDDAGIWSDGYHVILRLQNGRWTSFHVGGTSAFFIGEDDDVCNPLPPKIKSQVCVKA